MEIVCPNCHRHSRLSYNKTPIGVSTVQEKCKACGSIFEIDLQTSLREEISQHACFSPTTSFTEPNTGMDFVLIRPGEFNMGNDDGERDERPRHRVIISQPFYLGKFPVAQSQWEVVMGNNPSHFKGEDNPVENVTWYDSVQFVEKLNAIGEGAYRLPTEAEWEYACRAGTSTKFFFGNDDSNLSEYAWYYMARGSGIYHQTTHQVGLKKPNAWGLYDMLGNVLEWCWDRYGRDAYKEHQQEDPLYLLPSETRPITGSGLPCRVLRGGCYSNVPSLISCASRNYYEPDFRYSNIGFRIVRSMSGDLSLWKDHLHEEASFSTDQLPLGLQEDTTPSDGFVYILINPAFQRNCLKIGMTSRDPEQRARELSCATGVPAPYYVAYSVKVNNYRSAERKVHEALGKYRARGDREFFYLPLEKAINIISTAVER